MKTVVHAPGKINLTLEILARRPDGYHDIRSVLLPVNLFESVEVETRNDSLITCETTSEDIDLSPLQDLPLEKHLAVKAARAMQTLCGTQQGCDIRITKRIPIGAGMAGGSADAVGVITALGQLWHYKGTWETLSQMASTIGSDIPALLHGGAVLMEGRGERVSPLLRPSDPTPNPFWIVALFPGYPVSTKKIYNSCIPHLTRTSDLCNNACTSVRIGDVQMASQTAFNGLQETVTQIHPETEYFCTVLRQCGALSSILSGSGSTVFGFAESQAHALAIQQRLPKHLWSKVLSTLPDGVMAAHGFLIPRVMVRIHVGQPS